MGAPQGGLGYAVNDLDGRIVEITPAYAAALGWRVQDLVGRNFREIVAPEFQAAVVESFVASVETGEPSIVRCEYAVPDGTRLAADVSIMPVRDDLRHVVSVLIVPRTSTITPKLVRDRTGLVEVGRIARSGWSER